MALPRIAVITSYFPVEDEPYRGPTAYQTLRRLAGRAEIEVFAPFYVYPPALQPRRFRYRRLNLRFSPPDVRAQYFEIPALPMVTRPINGATCARYLRAAVDRFKPDLILNYTLYPEGHAAVALGRRLSVPVVLCAIGSDVRRIPDPVTRWLTGRAARQAAFVMTVSNELHRQVLALGVDPRRTQSVLNGVDRDIFRPRQREDARRRLGVRPDDRLVVFVGSICEAKGVRELIAAAAQLRDRQPRLRVVCLGDGVLRQSLTTETRARRLDTLVQFAGPKLPVEVAEWLAASDLLCLPSHSEGCPNAVLEALACGRPVVATDVGGISEVLTPAAGMLVRPHDPAALAEALHAALAVRWDSRRIADTFTRGWDDVSDDVYAICQRVLSGN